MEVQVGLLESDPKKKPRADASGAHVFSATRPPQVHRQSEQPPRYKTSAFHSDSELIRNGKSSFLPTPLQKPGIMEPALKFRSLQGSIQSHWIDIGGEDFDIKAPTKEQLGAALKLSTSIPALKGAAL